MTTNRVTVMPATHAFGLAGRARQHTDATGCLVRHHLHVTADQQEAQLVHHRRQPVLVGDGTTQLHFGIQRGTTVYFEASMLFALVGFVSTVAFAKFILRGDIIE